MTMTMMMRYVINADVTEDNVALGLWMHDSLQTLTATAVSVRLSNVAEPVVTCAH